MNKPGYHINSITKGVVGELSKIYEEVDEIKDAEEQGVDVMILLELSDLIGAIKCYLAKHHSSIHMTDLIKMSDITERAFKNEHRK